MYFYYVCFFTLTLLRNGSFKKKANTYLSSLKKIVINQIVTNLSYLIKKSVCRQSYSHTYFRYDYFS